MAGQLSFISRGPLFEDKSLDQYLSERKTTPIPGEAARIAALKEWVASLAATASQKETSLEQSFNQRVLVDVLGYRLHPSADASAYPKAPSSLTGIPTEPDVVLGSFAAGAASAIFAVLELKRPGTKLDAPQPRENKQTPVEQAFGYGEKILGVRWVLVSDMRTLRLYSADSPVEYESFDLRACVEGTAAGDNFRRLFFLLHHDYLVDQGSDSAVSRLLAKSLSRQRELKDSFYATYYQIRVDLFNAVRKAAAALDPIPDRGELLEAVQRLLDRLVFLYYCEDTPDQLIPKDTVRTVTKAARSLPGASDHKVYDALKALFREVDVGSPPANQVRLSGYNGELFKPHRIIDEIDLPDALHDHIYPVSDPDQSRRSVVGVWGLHEFDFWRELNEHLLGHIFEESLSDMAAISAGEPVSTADKLAQRQRHGIYYTTDIISDFLSVGALRTLLGEENTSLDADGDQADAALIADLEQRLERLASLRIVDFACGSGAFLVSAYQAMLREYWALTEAILSLRGAAQDLFSHESSFTQAKLLRDCLYGCDLLPQAVEISKLALWLRSARKEEKIANLGTNIVAGNSLDVAGTLAAMQAAEGSFDLVLGNPPWGGEVDKDTYQAACHALGIDPTIKWDSWELFLILGLRALRPGGRLALVLPDTIFRPEKTKTRQLLLSLTRIERLHNLGPDWFPNVRMGTVILQARRGDLPLAWDIQSMILGGKLREQAIRGEIPLTQVEAQLSRMIPQERSDTDGATIEIARSRADDTLIARMTERSLALSDVCWRGRGEEMSKSGLLWRCPSCLSITVPGEKAKGGGFKPKRCPTCDYELTMANTQPYHLVSRSEQVEDDPEAETVGFIDGDDIAHRYSPITITKWLRLGTAGFKYKPTDQYQGGKVLVRKTGVGLLATYDETDSRCPQTVFIYKVKPDWAATGYSPLFILGTLSSRAMAYLIYKRYGEADPDRPHAHVTYQRLDDLPIPLVDFTDPDSRLRHDRISEATRRLVSGEATAGGDEDTGIELDLRALWGLSADDGAYINSELALLPDSQVLSDLFPHGRPIAAIKNLAAALP